MLIVKRHGRVAGEFGQAGIVALAPAHGLGRDRPSALGHEDAVAGLQAAAGPWVVSAVARRLVAGQPVDSPW